MELGDWVRVCRFCKQRAVWPWAPTALSGALFNSIKWGTGLAPLLWPLTAGDWGAEASQGPFRSTPARRRLRAGALHLTLLSGRHDGLVRPAASPVVLAPPPYISPLPGWAAPSPGRHRSRRNLQPARPRAPDTATAAAILEVGTPPTATRGAALGARRGHFRPPSAAGASSSRERRVARSRLLNRIRERVAVSRWALFWWPENRISPTVSSRPTVVPRSSHFSTPSPVLRWERSYGHLPVYHSGFLPREARVRGRAGLCSGLLALWPLCPSWAASSFVLRAGGWGLRDSVPRRKSPELGSRISGSETRGCQ